MSRVPFLVAVLGLIGILALGGWFFLDQRLRVRAEVTSDLLTIARLKVAQIVSWRADVVSDATLVSRSPFLAARALSWLAVPSPAAEGELRAEFRAVLDHGELLDVVLVDPTGRVALSLTGTVRELGPEVLGTLETAVAERRVALTELHLHEEGGPIHMAAVAPLVAPAEPTGAVAGAVLMIVDAERLLFPLVESWPVPSSSAETTLFRRDGEEVLFLNEVRHAGHPALSLRIPRAASTVPAVRAVHGFEGVDEGPDYRGVPVLFATLPIPNSGWYMVSKMDVDEAFAQWRATSRLIMTTLAGFVLVGLMGLLLLWQRSLAQVRTAAYNRSLIEASLDPLVTMDVDGRIMDANAAAEAVTGRARSELAGTDFSLLFTDPAAARGGYRRVFTEGRVRDHPLEIRNVDGTVLPVVYDASVYRDPSGAVAGVVAAVRDASSLRHLQVALRESEASARRKLDVILNPAASLGSLDLGDIVDLSALRAVMEHASRLTGSVMALVDMRGKVLVAVGWQDICTKFHRVNPQSAALCTESDLELSSGVIPGEYKVYRCRNGLVDVATPVIVAGRHMGNFFTGQFFFEDEPPDEEVFRRQARQFGFPEDEYLAALRRVPRVGRDRIDAIMRFFSALATLVANLSWANVSLAKVREEELREQSSALEAANRELEAFSYSVSHDLRAPLRHVSGYVDMLGRSLKGRLDGKSARYMATIASAASEMGQLIDDLLAFSRLGRQAVRVEDVDLTALVADAIARLQEGLGTRRVSWRVEALPLVSADPALLRQVVTNLLDNALKYSRNRDEAHVAVETAGFDMGRVVVVVRDDGVGFDQKYVDRLFGVFQRLHRAEDFEGTGIGLANVRRIVERHGGRVWAEGRLDAGASFFFTLAPAARTRCGDGKGQS